MLLAWCGALPSVTAMDDQAMQGTFNHHPENIKFENNSIKDEPTHDDCLLDVEIDCKDLKMEDVDHCHGNQMSLPVLDQTCPDESFPSLIRSQLVTGEHFQDPPCWTCTTCGLVFTTKDSLCSHKEVHTATPEFICEVCLRVFSKRCYLHKHIKRVHEGTERRFACRVCNKAFHTINHLERHKSTKYHVANENKLLTLETSHVKPETHNDVFSSPMYGQVTCTICSQAFKLQCELAEHIRRIHDSTAQPFASTFCENAFDTYSHLKEQNQTKHAAKELFCDICSKLCIDEQDLTVHKMSHSQFNDAVSFGCFSERVEFPCMFCSKIYTNQQDLHSHLQEAHSVVQSLTNSIQDNVSVSQDSSDNRETKMAIIRDPVSYEYQHCFSNTNTEYPTTNELISCTRCLKTFMQQEQLTEHMKEAHSRFHDQALCDKSLDNSGRPKEHEKNKEFTRGVSLESLTEGEQLTAHKVPHTAESETILGSEESSNNRPTQEFLSDSCHLSVNSEDKLKLHQMSHTPEPCNTTENASVCELTPCGVCSETFSHQENLKKHIMDAHASVKQELESSNDQTSDTPYDLEDDRQFDNKLTCDPNRQEVIMHKLTHSTGDTSNRIENASSATAEQFPCSFCSEVFHMERVLGMHLRKAHRCIKKPFLCTPCEKAYDTYSHLKDHRKTKTHIANIQNKETSDDVRDQLLAGKQFPCNFCSEAFIDQESVNTHLRKGHSSIKKPFLCTPCEKAYDTYSHLKDHQKTKGHLTRELTCDVCHQLCYTKDRLMTHKCLHDLRENSKMVEDMVASKRFPCHFCQEVFLYQDSFNRHLRKSHGSIKQPFLCTLCNKAFDTFSHLKEHNRTKSHSEKVLSSSDCPQESIGTEEVDLQTTSHCKKDVTSKNNTDISLRDDKVSFSQHEDPKTHFNQEHNAVKNPVTSTVFFQTCKTSSYCKEHVRHHANGGMFSCSICKASFDCKTCLIQHNKSHVEVVRLSAWQLLQRVPTWTFRRPHRCNICSLRFRTVHMLHWHHQVHSSRPPECSVCRNKFCQEQNKSHQSLQLFQCDLCSKKFPDLQDVKRHRKIHFGSTNAFRRRFVCNICQKGFLRKRALKTHRRTHLDHRPFACPNCDKRFLSQKTLRNHLLNHNRSRDYKCAICECRSFFDSIGLKAHMKFYHSKEREFKLHVCDLCGKRYGHRTSLLYHMLTHDDQRPFECKICKKTFRSRSLKRLHEKRHTESRPFICDHCNRGFKTRSCLRAHQRRVTASKIRPFLCPQCGKTFAVSSQLKRHQAIHTEYKEFICEVCGKTCSRRDNLRTHMKVHRPKHSKNM